MQKITRHTLSDRMFYGVIPVLLYKINYPSFTTTCSPQAAETINHYYARAAKGLETICRTVLYRQALESARYIPSGSPPFHSYTLDVLFQVTYNKGCITSLYFDTYVFMGGAHGETKRTSDTWDFSTGGHLGLNQFYPLAPSSLEKLQGALTLQVKERMTSDPGSYFEDFQALIPRFFRPENFYLTPEGFVIFFQQYDISPYATGLPEFLYKYKTDS